MNDKKIVRPSYLNTADGGIFNLPPNQQFMFRVSFFGNDYLLDFNYNHEGELYRLLFKNESFIKVHNFHEGIDELNKLISMIEAKYGEPELKQIGNNPGDYFIAQWNLEKEILLGIQNHPDFEGFYQILMVFSYSPMVIQEEAFENQQEEDFIDSEIDYF
jgi:hypothetical protein